jgi:hypothetical protein
VDGGIGVSALMPALALTALPLSIVGVADRTLLAEEALAEPAVAALSCLLSSLLSFTGDAGIIVNLVSPLRGRKADDAPPI